MTPANTLADLAAEGLAPVAEALTGLTQENAAQRLASARRVDEPAGTLLGELQRDASSFDFFQAVRLLERAATLRGPVGRDEAPAGEAVRFRARASFAFPASSIQELRPPQADDRPPELVTNFFGLTGATGALPTHYTERLQRLERDGRAPGKFALRDFFDLFHHRLISLFYRAWAKYRGVLPLERGEATRREPDTFTAALRSVAGLNSPALQGRLTVARQPSEDSARGETLGRIDDLGLLRFAGSLGQRPRSAANLVALLREYFRVPVAVKQFVGQWLRLDEENQSRLGGAQSRLGRSVVLGERVWDVQGQFRVVLGPLDYEQFVEFLPDKSPAPRRKAFFLLSHLARLAVGPELDFQVQLRLRGSEMPRCKFDRDAEVGPRLGWNTWLCAKPPQRDAEDAVFAGEACRRV